MTEVALGTARLDVVVGTEQFDAAIQLAQTRISGMSSAAQAEYAKLNAAQKRNVDSLLKQADTYGKSRQEVILYNAALRGTPTHILDELRTKLTAAATAARQASGDIKNFTISPTQLYAANKSLADFRKGLGDNKTAAVTATNAMNQYGLSAKQQSAALRQVPAQITDIFTSLASGQRPLLVLLQQGGQLKDIFGGIAPAARALGSAVLGLINPFTVAAAAVVGLGLAWKTAEEESQAFNLAIIQTGNYAQKSATDLEALAARLDETTSATGRFSADIIAQVVATGRFTGQQVDVISESIVNMAKAVQTAGGDADQAVNDLIKSFTDISKDPVEALLKLNETQHFLKQGTLDQVKALKEQGNEAGAVEVAIKAMADTLNQRAPEMVRNVNSASAVFAGLKSVVAETTDEVVKFFRNADSAAQNFIRNHQASVGLLAKLQSIPILPFGGTQSKITQSLLDHSTRPLEPVMIGFKTGGPVVDSKEEREAIAFKDRYLTREEQKEKAIAELKRLKAHYTAEEYKILQKGIEDRFKPPKGPKGEARGIESATSRAAIQALEDQLKKEQGLLANQKQVLEANYAARNVLVADYYREQKRLVQENTVAQERALEGEIAALQSRSLKGKDSINNARELAEREAELAKVRADGATALQVLNIQEAAQLKQRQQANIAYQDALDQGRDALRAEMDSQVMRITVGEREFEIRSRIIQLYRDEAKELLNLARQRDAGEIDPDTYKQRVDQLRSAIADEVRIVQSGYDAMAEAQKKWQNGALKAFADYRDAANDVAGQTYSLFSNAFSGLEDVLVDFITKGKADWKGFLDSILAESTRMLVRQQLSKLFNKFMPDEKEADSAQALSGAAASLAASAAPLYGAAAALSASASALAAAGVGGAASEGESGGFNWASVFGAAASFLGNANGNAFKGGEVMAFANGGIFDRPTMFGMSGGRMGVMGEAGPEAIMPLSRGSDGKLGVRAEVPTAKRGDIVQHNTYHIAAGMDRRAREAARYDNARNLNRAQRRNG